MTPAAPEVLSSTLRVADRTSPEAHLDVQLHTAFLIQRKRVHQGSLECCDSRESRNRSPTAFGNHRLRRQQDLLQDVPLVVKVVGHHGRRGTGLHRDGPDRRSLQSGITNHPPRGLHDLGAPRRAINGPLARLQPTVLACPPGDSGFGDGDRSLADGQLAQGHPGDDGTEFGRRTTSR